VQNNSAFTDIRVDKSADQLAHMQLARGTGEIIAVHQRLGFFPFSSVAFVA
jgi:hypothetical protein